jgi:heat shock protein HslJ
MEARFILLSIPGLLLAGCAAQTSEASKNVTYVCEGNANMALAFGDGTAILRLAEGDVTLSSQPVASGVLYSGSGHSLQGKGPELDWTDPSGAVRHCRDKEWATAPQGQPPVGSLAGTSWTLAWFESSDDAIGRIIPPRLERYTMAFSSDGSAAFQLDCNRARAQWSASPSSSGGGRISFSPGMMTRAMCGPGAIDSRISADLSRLRSYTLRDGRLYLALEMDGGIYAWDPGAPASD